MGFCRFWKPCRDTWGNYRPAGISRSPAQLPAPRWVNTLEQTRERSQYCRPHTQMRKGRCTWTPTTAPTKNWRVVVNSRPANLHMLQRGIVNWPEVAKEGFVTTWACIPKTYFSISWVPLGIISTQLSACRCVHQFLRGKIGFIAKPQKNNFVRINTFIAIKQNVLKMTQNGPDIYTVSFKM